jgi:RimJ/RimL family protein N-acetyltransferase
VTAPATQAVVARAARVLIRYRTRADALDDFHWRRDPEIARFDAREPFAGTFSDFLRAYLAEIQLPDPSRAAFAIDTTSGVHVGSVMYYNVAAGGQAAEMGVTLGRGAYRDAGLGTEAVVAFLLHVWSTTAIRRVYLHTLEWNERARRCFEKAGFVDQAIVLRGDQRFVRMDVQREWWLLWEQEGRFARYFAPG